MAPPQYSDVGKAAKDLFDKGFNYGSIQCDVKGPLGHADVTLKTATAVDPQTNSLSSFGGSFETKFKHQKHGITFVQNMHTNGTIGMDLGVEDGPLPITKGGKATLCTSFTPGAEKVMTALLKTSYKNDYVNMSLENDFNCAGPKVKGTYTNEYEGFIFGHAFTYDMANRALTANNVALAFIKKDIQGTLIANDWTKYTASLYHSINKNLSLGTMLNWNKGDAATTMAVAAKYSMGCCGAAQLKVSSNGEVAAAFMKTLSPGVKMTASACLDTKGTGAGHKFGVGVEYQL